MMKVCEYTAGSIELPITQKCLHKNMFSYEYDNLFQKTHYFRLE